MEERHTNSPNFKLWVFYFVHIYNPFDCIIIENNVSLKKEIMYFAYKSLKNPPNSQDHRIYHNWTIIKMIKYPEFYVGYILKTK